MTLLIDRRTMLGMGMATLTVTLSRAPAWAAGERITGDIVLGAADAPLTVIAYLSFTCPHCARFHIETWPEIKANYIDTGKVRFIMREAYYDQYGLWASMIARCGGEQGFYPMVDVFLKEQPEWSRALDINAALVQIGQRAGLSLAQLQACLTDQDYGKSLVESYKKNATADNLYVTPTFLINGNKHTGLMRYDFFVELLEAAL